ncbi:hypothetical protein MPL1032_30286 [Mesorhizobium plurifarium]|uniref:Uncharacterized protein n=1 Tax=Mesorhizobium plurifarium TaxID=69974 RepID=A0A0K2W3A2_MESPL|nr:hypothetical protein MPL1032_30286 [Mesorhizobium plurifarium]
MLIFGATPDGNRYALSRNCLGILAACTLSGRGAFHTGARARFSHRCYLASSKHVLGWPRYGAVNSNAPERDAVNRAGVSNHHTGGRVEEGHDPCRTNVPR